MLGFLQQLPLFIFIIETSVFIIDREPRGKLCFYNFLQGLPGALFTFRDVLSFWRFSL